MLFWSPSAEHGDPDMVTPDMLLCSPAYLNGISSACLEIVEWAVAWEELVAVFTARGEEDRGWFPGFAGKSLRIA